MYRRTMLEEIGLFDEKFFLYCEDTDLGLRARWAGWDCVYVAGAVVEHRYSHSAGRASPLKAYYVERNRLYTVIRNFPWSMLIWTKAASMVRFFWHAVSLMQGHGKAAEFRGAGHVVALLPWLVVRAHLSALMRLPTLWSERRKIRATRRLSVKEFRAVLAAHSISLRRVAEL
jgi:GT2 family glycosyltransferase